MGYRILVLHPGIKSMSPVVDVLCLTAGPLGHREVPEMIFLVDSPGLSLRPWRAEQDSPLG